MTNTELFAKIQQHLASGGVVVVATIYRQTTYTTKHVSMLVAASDASGSGVWVKRGKSRDFVMPQYLRFGRYVAAEGGR